MGRVQQTGRSDVKELAPAYTQVRAVSDQVAFCCFPALQNQIVSHDFSRIDPEHVLVL